MGLFSKTRVYVESFASPLVEDSPNLIRQSVQTSIYGNRDISTDLRTNITKSLGVNLGRYYRKGRDEYYYGLPFGSIQNRGVAIPVMEATLESIVGEPVLVEFSLLTEPDPYLFALDFLLYTRQLDEDTQIVSNPPSGAVGATTLDMTEFVSTTEIGLTYTDAASTTWYEVHTLSEPVVLENTYYHVGYYLYDENEEPILTQKYFWYYDPSTGVYPDLDPYYEEDSLYMPAVPIRFDNTDFSIDDGSERYKTSKSLLRTLNLSMSTLGEGVNSSPDIDDIDHATMVLGISPATENMAAKKYLFSFFKEKEFQSSVTKADFDAWDNETVDHKDNVPPPLNTLKISQAGISYRIEWGWMYITSELKTGVIEPDANVGDVVTEIVTRNAISGKYYGYTDSSLYLRRQISATTYEELDVRGLKSSNEVYNSHSVDTNLEDVVNAAADPDDYSDNMLIPLSINLVEGLRVVDRDDLVKTAMHLMFNCYVKQKLKWYETGFFKAIVTIVSVVVSVYTFGSTTGAIGAWLGLGTGITAITVGALALGVIIAGVQYGVAYLIEVLGIEVGFFLVLAGLAASFFPGGSFFSAELLATIQAGIQGGYQQFIDGELEDIMNDYNALQAEMDSYREEMNEFYSDINTTALTDPILSASRTSGLALPNESPDQYYNTRIHIGNMAPIDKAHIESYVSSRLTLPKMGDTIGDL